MSYEKYGLTATNATSSDYKKGIVKAPDGNYYQIDGFKSQGEDEGGIDQNDGKVFSSSLEADARAASDTYDPTTFNTANDVENALRNLGGVDEAPEEDDTPYVPSEQIKQARERVKNWEEKLWRLWTHWTWERVAGVKGNGEKTGAALLKSISSTFVKKLPKVSLEEL